MRDDHSAGLLLIGAGCLPFAVGGAITVAGGEDSETVLCPFRLTTGIPCPLCGGTRAFAYASSGDPKFLSYNGFWVFVAVAMIILGVLMAFTRFSVRGFWRRPYVALVVVVAMFAGGWIWSLANQSTILG